MLSTVIRRSARYTDSPVGIAPGPLAVFVLVPILRQVVHGVDSGTDNSEEVRREFNTKAGALLDALVANGGSEGVFSATCLAALTGVAGFPLSLDQCRQLLEFCAGHLDMSEEPPWASWGVLPPPMELACAVSTRWGKGASTGWAATMWLCWCTGTGLNTRVPLTHVCMHPPRPAAPPCCLQALLSERRGHRGPAWHLLPSQGCGQAQGLLRCPGLQAHRLVWPAVAILRTLHCACGARGRCKGGGSRGGQWHRRQGA
jgi:hypothetical protein